MRFTYCRSCGRSIVWLFTKNKKRIPVDVGPVTADDVEYDHTRHVAHFATCPDAAKWHAKTKAKAKAAK